MPKYTMIVRADNAIRILKDGEFYFSIGVYRNTLSFKLQEIAQKVLDALNKFEEKQ